MATASGPTLWNKCDILSEIWYYHRDNEEFEDFLEMYDIGLPLAYFLREKICLPTKAGQTLIEDTYDALIEKFGVSDNYVFADLDELISKRTI